MSRPKPANFNFDYTFPPGDTLAEVLSERGMKQAELARRTGLSVKLVNHIIQGLAPISADTALRLERVTDLSALFWASLEAGYQVARVEDNEAARLAAESGWLSAVPVKELQARRWLSKTTDKLTLAREALSFFKVATPEAWSEVWAVPTAYRKSQAYEPDYGSLAAWIRIGEIRATDLDLPEYDRTALRNSLGEVRSLTNEEDFTIIVARLTEICRRVGVALIIEKEIKGARINGLVRWLPSGNPLIMLSLRYSWADIFWFTFFHEAGHLLVHDRKRSTIIDLPTQGNSDPDMIAWSSDNKLLEAEADDFAGRMLIARVFDQQLRQTSDGAGVELIAAQAGVHPGIVVGRLQHDRIIPFSQLNALRRRFKFADPDG